MTVLLTQMRQMLIRITMWLSLTLKSTAEALDEMNRVKADKSDIPKPEAVEDGIVFKDGNGNVIYKFPVMR